MSILNNQLKEEYLQFYQFYQNSWQGNFKYRIYLTANDKTLNEEFYHTFMGELNISNSEKERIKDIRTSTFTNDFGIRTKIPELVNYFLENGELPKILVIISETDYGIEYAKFFYELEKLIIDEWQKRTNKLLTDDDYYSIHHAISHSLNVRIYKKYSSKGIIVDSNYFLLDNVLESTIEDIIDFPSDRRFVSQTNIGISENKAKRNRNYFPTFMVPLSDFKKMHNNLENNDDWQEKTWRYNSRLYRMIISNNNSNSLFEILSCITDKSNNCAYIVPNIFTGGLTPNLRTQLINELQTFFSNNNLIEFKKILDYDNEGTINGFHLTEGVKFELIYSLMSISLFIRYLNANDFISNFQNDYSIDENIASFNQASIEKICQNFGTISDVYTDYNEFMRMMLTSPNALDEFNKIIYQYFGKKAYSLNSINTKLEDVYTNDKCIYVASDYFIDLEHNNRDNEHEAIKENYRYGSRYVYYRGSSLIDYLKNLDDSFSMDNKICALICLIDQGYIEQSIAICNTDLDYFHILPDTYLLELKKLERFMPALISLKRNCDLNGLIFEVWSEKFAKCISTKLPEYANDDLSSLFYKFSHYIELIYSTIDDWYCISHNVFKPELTANAPFRTIKEWCGKPWSNEELEQIENINADEYMNMECQIREELRQFLLDNFLELKKYNTSPEDVGTGMKLIKKI